MGGKKDLKAPPGIDPEAWKDWDEASKKKLLDAIELAQKKKYAWYCTVGRTCDGLPHEGYDYKHARGDQWPPEGTDWFVWMLKGGRGSGKTRSGAEWIRKLANTMPRVSIIGPTWSHVRDVMVEGESGLLFTFERAGITALWEPSKRKITVPCSCPVNTRTKRKPHKKGHIVQVFTGEEPDRLRGPVHWAVWLDEPAHIALIEDVWDMMLLGLRGGKRPLILCTTTPLPTKCMKELLKKEDTVAVTVSTYANIDNLATTFRKTVLDKYEGTRLGRQELHGEILEDVEGALWNWAWITDNRDRLGVTIEDMERIVVGIDPSGTNSKKRDETGIIVVGRKNGHYYVFADGSDHYSPEGWAKKAWKLFDKYMADKIVAEKNYGGDMVRSTLTNARQNGPVELVTSRRGKELRAEPVSALYEQGVVHHVGIFKELEEQMTEWVPGIGDSPDRVDALVHAITALNKGGGPGQIAVPGAEPMPSAGNPFVPPAWDAPPTHLGYKPREEVLVGIHVPVSSDSWSPILPWESPRW